MMWETKREEDGYIIHTRIYPKPIHTCAGINSNARDNKHIVMIDYDDADLSVIKQDIRYLQGKYPLSLFFIYQTGPMSWHVRSPHKVTYQELYTILSDTHCDPYILTELKGFKRHTTNRISPRGSRPAPYVVDVIVGKGGNEISRGHYEIFKGDTTNPIYLKKLSEFERSATFDDSAPSEIGLVAYQTAKGAEGFGEE